MKKAFFLISTLFYCLSCLGQQVSLSEVVDLSPPKGAEKISKEQLISYVKANFHKSKVSPDHRNIYKMDGIIVSFWDLSVTEENKKTLEASKSELLEVLQRNKALVISEAKIITVNNIQFLILKYREGDDAYLRFYSDYRNNKDISGLIQFKNGDDQKARNALQDMLESIHFK